MSTPHISCQKGDFAETVIFPGDPLRAHYIATEFLTNAREVTRVRNVFGYTGNYQGTPVSVMASGMGIPSSAIYATELITQFDVRNLIRIGTSGALPNSNLRLNDIVLVLGASTDSNMNRIRFNDFDLAATCDFHLLNTIYNTAQENNIRVTVGDCFTTDTFYTPDLERYKILERMGILCVEMETAGVYGVAKAYNARALTLVTISDIIGDKGAGQHDGPELSSKERETGLNNMIELTLRSIRRL